MACQWLSRWHAFTGAHSWARLSSFSKFHPSLFSCSLGLYIPPMLVTPKLSPQLRLLSPQPQTYSLSCVLSLIRGCLLGTSNFTHSEWNLVLPTPQNGSASSLCAQAMAPPSNYLRRLETFLAPQNDSLKSLRPVLLVLPPPLGEYV